MTDVTGARGRAFAALLLVFLAGGGVGWAAGARSTDHRDGRGRGRGGPRPGMLLDAGPIARYDLTPGQRARVDSILTDRRSQIDAFWRGPGQELRRVLDATAADVRAVLTPVQQARFDSARARHQERMRARFGGRGGGPPFPPPPDSRGGNGRAGGDARP